MSGFGCTKDGKTNMRVYMMFSDFSRTYKLPFKYDIPNYTESYLKSASFFKRMSKFLRRYLYIFFTGQSKLEQNEILDNHKNILWINLSAPSLGDSLMDLSSRVLLENKNVDLYTDKKNAHIYLNDKIFKSVIIDENKIEDKYDLVIIDSYSTRSLKIKIKNLKNRPFVGMYGYYNGPEVNRVLYSFHQMNALLGYPNKEEKINTTAKTYMYISKEDKSIIDNLELPKNFISIVLGGEWDYRTYNSWDKVIEKIYSINENTNIVFIGSSNAIDIAEDLTKKFKDKSICNCVAKFTFSQTAEIIKRANIQLCCDGGLMHAANGVGTTILPLFAHLTPQMQLTNAIEAFALFDKHTVNNIDEKSIIEKYKVYLEEK